MTQYIDKSALVAEIEKLKDNCLFDTHAYNMCDDILSFLDTLEVKEVQEEPVSEDLEEAALLHLSKYYDTSIIWEEDKKCVARDFKAGALWQKEHLWKPADGDDLPEIDREVIAIVDYDFGHYKVVYAHRPNPNGWDGTNIDTGEKEHFEPVIYDKGGWNQPHVLYWLDARLPYEENKIIE